MKKLSLLLTICSLTRTTSFVFLYEDGAWKLDDVYTFRGAFATSESLSQYFREK